MVVAYIFMLIFDFAVLVGTAYLVSERGFSAWWFLLAVTVIAASDPKSYLKEKK